MRRLFKDMPKNINEIGKWRIEVTAIFPTKTNIVYSDVYNGRLWVAYLKLRLKALLKDLATIGEPYGIGWEIKKENLHTENQ